MGVDLFAVDRILGFLLVLTRISGVFVFVPLPGVSSSPVTAKIVLSIAMAACLFPMAPAAAGLDQSVVTPDRIHGHGRGGRDRPRVDREFRH